MFYLYIFKNKLCINGKTKEKSLKHIMLFNVMVLYVLYYEDVNNSYNNNETIRYYYHVSITITIILYKTIKKSVNTTR